MKDFIFTAIFFFNGRGGGGGGGGNNTFFVPHHVKEQIYIFYFPDRFLGRENKTLFILFPLKTVGICSFTLGPSYFRVQLTSSSI